MKIGLVADIHEDVELAAAAIRMLRRRGVDEIICLGDFCEMGLRLHETCELLLHEQVACVWGNHDFGLCADAREGAALEYSQSVIDYAKSAQPRIKRGDFVFMHVEPWLDPQELTDLWYFDGLPTTDDKRSRIFADEGWDIAFAGHMHCWFATAETKQIIWDGKAELDLSCSRNFVMIDACLNGQFAVFDSNSRILTPLSIHG